MNVLVITFSIISDTMEAQDAFRKDGRSCRLIPVPRQLSAGCGIAISCDKDLETEARELLDRERIPYEGFHIMDI